MSSHRNSGTILTELNGYLDGLIRFFATYEFSDAVKNVILPQLKSARARAIELGELMTNDPENKEMQMEMKQLTTQTRALTRQITKMVSENDEKDKEIEELKAKLKKYEGENKEKPKE